MCVCECVCVCVCVWLVIGGKNVWTRERNTVDVIVRAENAHKSKQALARSHITHSHSHTSLR